MRKEYPSDISREIFETKVWPILAKARKRTKLHIPTQIGHPFRSKPATVSEVKSATYSDPNRPRFPT